MSRVSLVSWERLIPIRDTIPCRTVPMVNNLLILVNVGAFVVEWMHGDRLGELATVR